MGKCVLEHLRTQRDLERSTLNAEGMRRSLSRAQSAFDAQHLQVGKTIRSDKHTLSSLCFSCEVYVGRALVKVKREVWVSQISTHEARGFGRQCHEPLSRMYRNGV